MGESGLVASKSSILLGPFIKKDVFTPSEATSSSLYAGTPNNFSNKAFDAAKLFTAMPICSILFIIFIKIYTYKDTYISIAFFVFLHHGNKQTEKNGSSFARRIGRYLARRDS